MRNAEDVERYKAEPYAVAADVYAHPMHVGRGGWTWYTGLGGMDVSGGGAGAARACSGPARPCSINPCIPTVWPEYSLEWRVGRSRYRFVVSNPDHLSHGIARAKLDGADVDPAAIPLVDDGAEHDVSVLMGSESSMLRAAGAGSRRASR